MGNIPAKLVPVVMRKARKIRKDKDNDGDNVQNVILPAPLLPIAVWKNNMQMFMNNHIQQLEGYTESEIMYVKYRLKRLEEGYDRPHTCISDEHFAQSIASIKELMDLTGEWHIMYEKACHLIDSYIEQNRQGDLENLAFMFCVLVIAPQIIKSETRWSWGNL